MAKHGVRFKPEKIVSLLRQIEVLTANGKTLDEACKSLSITVQNYYRWRKMYGGMKEDCSIPRQADIPKVLFFSCAR